MLSRKVMSGGAPVDPYFKNVTLLLHGDGTNGGQNNTFIDGSSNNFTITRNGNTTQGSFNPYGALWSNYFDGSGDYLQWTGTALGSGDFTVECFVNLQVLSANKAVIGSAAANTSAGWEIFTATDKFYFYSNGSSTITTTQVLTIGRWYHVAAVRSGSTLTLYIDGVNSGSATFTANLTNTTMYVSNDFAGQVHNAYVSNVRHVVGTAVYTANFTPPTSNLTAISGTSVLTCQSNRFIDNSTNNFAITRNGDVKVTSFAPFAPTSVYTTGQGASGYFDGTDDYLSVADNVNLRPGAGAFTIEAWIYRNASGAAHTIFAKGGASTGVVFQVTSGDLLRFTHTTTNIDSTGTVAANAWVHVAVVREGTGTNQTKLYINGTADGQGTVSTDFTQTEEARIGTDRSAASDFNGYISNFRLVKGTAVYTAAFTPPTSPLTAITNTSLLCNFKNAAIFDSAAKNDLETVGNAQIDTTTKKFGTGSLEFDGTGDYLILQPTPTLEPSGGNLTWEMWVNTSSSTQYATLYSRMPSSFSAGMWSLLINYASAAAGDVSLYLGDYSLGSPLLQTSGVNIRDSNWHHIAVVRNGSSWVLYVDGTSRATNTWTGTITALASAQTWIGIDPFSSGRDYLGYIDDFRITNGVARYTANFTPPTRPFPDK